MRRKKASPPVKFTREPSENVWELALWANEHLGEEMTLEEAGSASRLEFFRHVSDPANRKEFYKNLLPQAQAAYDAANRGAEDSIIEIEEKKSVAELRLLLQDAIGEAIAPYKPPSPKLEDLLQ